MFDGAFSITVANKTDINFSSSSSYTITAWVKPNGTQSPFAGIVCKGPSYNHYSGYQLCIYGNNGLAQISSSSSSDTGDLIIQGNTVVTDGNWHLLTLVVMAHQSASLYVDSVLEVMKMDTNMIPDFQNTDPLFIGNERNGVDFFKGAIGDVIILGRALSPNEIQTRFHEGGWYSHPDTVVVIPPPQTGFIPGNFGTSQSIGCVCFPYEALNGQFLKDGSVGYACGAAGTMLRSHDSGITWQSMGNYTNENLYHISFYDLATGVVGGNNGALLRTTDGGNNWTPIGAPFQTVNGGLENIRDIKFIDDTHVIMVGGAGNTQNPPSDGFIMTSSDAGQTWTRAKTTSIGLYSIGFNPEGNIIRVVGSVGQILFSPDMGVTWNDQSITQAGDDFLAIDYCPLNNFSYGMGTTAYGTIYSDYGASWNQNGMGSSGVQSALRTVKLTSTTETWIAGDNGVILHSTNSGMSWSRADISNVSVNWNQIVSRDAHTLAFVGTNGTLYWYKY